MRSYPRALDLSKIKFWLNILREPIPLNEISKRKLKNKCILMQYE